MKSKITVCFSNVSLCRRQWILFEIIYATLKLHYLSLWQMGKSGNNRSYKIIAIYFLRACIPAINSPSVYFQIKQWSCLFPVKKETNITSIDVMEATIFRCVCARQLSILFSFSFFSLRCHETLQSDHCFEINVRRQWLTALCILMIILKLNVSITRTW